MRMFIKTKNHAQKDVGYLGDEYFTSEIMMKLIDHLLKNEDVIAVTIEKW